jgi:hypothetical protein
MKSSESQTRIPVFNPLNQNLKAAFSKTIRNIQNQRLECEKSADVLNKSDIAE